jgi:putative MATE family efflux protein
VLLTAVGLSVFLAYGTTAAVARRIGAGDRPGAIQHGIDGLWLALLIGAALALLLGPAAPWWVGLIGGGAGQPVLDAAVTYLRWSTLGLPAMLAVLAATGVLRGLERTMPTLLVAVAGAIANVPLNLLLVHGAGWGVAGSAIGTVIVQNAMAIALIGLVLRGAAGTALRPSPRRIGAAGRAGGPIVVRTLALRVAILLTVAVGAAKGEVALAGLQVTMNIWNLLALALDAVAIAAQALTARALGAGDAAQARALTRLMLRWGTGAALALAVPVLLLAPAAGTLFTDDAAVRHAIAVGMVVLAAGLVVAGPVFVLDGVFLGAGDGRFLAVGSVAVLAVYLPALGAVARLAPDGAAGLAWIWVGYTAVFMTARLAALVWRYRRDEWLVLGAARGPGRRPAGQSSKP